MPTRKSPFIKLLEQIGLVSFGNLSLSIRVEACL